MKRLALQGGLAVLLVVLVGVVGPAVASPQPTFVCGACGGPFEQAAADQNVALNVTASTATVQVHENGSATWTVANRINESAASKLSRDQALLESVARAAVYDGRGLPHSEEGVEFGSASIADTEVTIRFHQDAAADRHAGLLVTDTFHSDGVRGGWILNTDRFSIVGPPGTEIVNEPSETIADGYATGTVTPVVDGQSVTWRGSTTQAYDSIFYEDVYVVFGSSETSEQEVAAGVGLATAPIWIDNVETYVLPAVILYALLLGGLLYGVRRGASGNPVQLARLVAALGIVGIAGAVGAQLTDELAFFGGLGAIYLVGGVVALHRPGALRSVRGTLAVATWSLVAAGFVVHLVERIGSSSGPGLAWTLRQTAYHLPVAVSPLLGLAVARNAADRSRWWAACAYLVCVGSFLLAGMTLVPVDRRPFGLIILFTTGGAILASILSLSLAVLSARVWMRDCVDETV